MGMDVIVIVGIVVSVGTTLVTGAHEAKIKAINETVMMFFIFIDTLLCKEMPNGLRYWRWGGRGLCLGTEKNSKPEKYSKTAQTPQRPVLA